LNKTVRYTSLMLLCFLVVPLISCQKSQPSAAKETKAPPQAESQPATSSGPTPQAYSAAMPGVAALREVIGRVYKDVVIVDETRSTAVLGDFNGDNSEDIAIVVRPSNRMLAEINSEYANWILEDPISVGEFIAVRSGPHPGKEPPPTVVHLGDTLLAVVHGHQQAGWRNPQATQTYLLRNAVGDTLEMQHARSVLGETADNKSLPQLHGDIIRETLTNKRGFLYWTGAKYAWHYLI
jgi:hypothetical protein